MAVGQKWLSILSQLLPEPEVVDAREKLDFFQFFPSCCRGARGSSPSPAGLSILSQLLHQPAALVDLQQHVIFQFFPSCCGGEGWQSTSSLTDFQFFPSCCIVTTVRGYTVETVNFQFFPSCCRASGCASRAKCASAAFQFFPSCCRDSRALHPYKPFLREFRSSRNFTRTAS